MKKAIAEKRENAAPEAREATREEGRIIYAKLEEVYRDEKYGYQDGWSDQRVATDLGVPLAWVVKVRVQFFGPEAGNQEVRQVLEQAKAMLRAVQQVQVSTTDQLKAFEREAGLLQARIDRIEQQMGVR